MHKQNGRLGHEVLKPVELGSCTVGSVRRGKNSMNKPRGHVHKGKHVVCDMGVGLAIS